MQVSTKDGQSGPGPASTRAETGTGLVPGQDRDRDRAETGTGLRPGQDRDRNRTETRTGPRPEQD
jgi:hypothetical protein